MPEYLVTIKIEGSSLGALHEERIEAPHNAEAQALVLKKLEQRGFDTSELLSEAHRISEPGVLVFNKEEEPEVHFKLEIVSVRAVVLITLGTLAAMAYDKAEWYWLTSVGCVSMIGVVIAAYVLIDLTQDKTEEDN